MYPTRQERNSSQLKSEINNSSSSSSPRAIVCPADVSDPTQLKSLFDAAEHAFNSPPHIFVNSAGVLDPKYPTVANTSLEDFDKIFGINNRGSFLCCKEAACRIKRGGGGIILMSSSMVGALRPGIGAYAASKAAVEAMAKIMAKELNRTWITVNCVVPGPIATDMFFAGQSEEDVTKAIEESPLSRLGETKDAVSVVGILASDGGEWLNGQVIGVNGGYV